MLTWDFLVFFLSALIAFASRYYHLPITFIQQITAGLIVIHLIVTNRFFSPAVKVRLNKQIKIFLLFFSSLFINLLVISSGGFYSPFLILLYLYALGTSFLLNFSASSGFLIFALILLAADTLTDPFMLALFKNDPWSVVLYLAAFTTIIPLSYYLMRTYHLKDTVSRLLIRHLQMEQLRQKSILTGLSELVLVTNPDLKVISANEAVEKALQLSVAEIAQKPLLSLLPIKDQRGAPATRQSLSIDAALVNRSSYIINGLSIQTPFKTYSGEVVVQVRPLIDPEGQINQIVFVITAAEHRSYQQHADLDQAQQHYKILVRDLKQLVISQNTPKVRTELELLEKIEDDLLNALKIEDHPVREKQHLKDIALICQQIVVAKQSLAQTFNVDLKFTLPKEETAEAALLDLYQSNLAAENLPESSFAIMVNSKWLDLIIQKLLDMAILLSFGQKQPVVELTVDKTALTSINITITASYPGLTEQEKPELFQKYYGNLGRKTNLQLGSGLEGFIVQTITSQLHIPLSVKSFPNHLAFILQLPKGPY